MGQVIVIASTIAVAFAASLALTPLARHMAWKIGAVSQPDGQRRLHLRPTALWGGGAVYLGVLLSVVASFFLASHAMEDRLPAALGLSAGMLCLLGFYDDLYDIRAGWKLLGQIVCTLPVLMAGCYVREFTLFGRSVDVGLLGVPWTIGWLVLGINALNLLDGVDGLASLMGIVISLAVGVIAATQSRPEVMLLAFALAGALAGFLVHNLPPARVYLGDCGSMVIGFTLALLALRVSLSPQHPTTVNLTVAAALLFVPLVDTALAIVRRTLKGCSFMVADHSHVHHQLVDRGLSIWKTLGVLGGFGLISGAVAWWVSLSGHDLWGWAVLATATILLVNRQLLAREEWKLTKRLVRQTVVPFVERLWLGRPASGSRSTNRAATASPINSPPNPVLLRTKASGGQLDASIAENRKAA